MRNDVGPKTEAADQLHAMKYRGPNEDFREAMNRVAFGLADNGNHYHEFREILLDMRFLPGGRVQGAIGAQRKTTAFNCYVAPTIDDAYVGNVAGELTQDSIMGVAHVAAATMRMGGGIGYDFSTLRPRGALIAQLESHSSGPVSFMKIFDAVCLATSSSGHRRGAQMGVLRIDHPDVEEFIRSKQREGVLTGFNISLAVTDDFMEALAAKRPFDLKFKGQVHKTVDAEELWEKVMRSTWDYGDPGVLFIDRINAWNNLHYCETIAATNPCAEQPLPPNGACLLGSFNLTKYIVKEVEHDLYSYRFDFARLRADIPTVVRAMDNTVDRTLYPLAMQKAEAQNKRRMGLGVTGLANAAEACCHVYGSPAFLEFEERVLETIKVECYIASANLAKEKGAFPLFNAERYTQGKFIQTLPDDVQALIKTNGIRNSHLTSIAPTGTISMCADNVSGGLEPVFAYQTVRPINTPDGQVIATVGDYGAEFLEVRGKLAADVTAAEHVAVLIAAQKHVDSSISKTCNVDGSMAWDDFKRIYTDVYEGGGKGCTTFNADGRKAPLLVASPEGQMCEVINGARNCE